MSNINIRTGDSAQYGKDCFDFVKLEDGTKTGDYRYCKLSNLCRQIDVRPDGKTFGMEAHLLPVYDALGNLVEHQLFCTGFHDKRSKNERLEDDKVS